MKLGTFTSFFAGAALMLAAPQVQAQTVYWGYGSGDATQEAQGQFDGGLSGWTTTSRFDGNNTTGGNALWTAGVVTQGGFGTGTDSIASPTRANGAAIFDSNFLDDNGVQGAFGSGVAPSPHSGELVSPTMDLSAAAGEQVMLSYYSHYRRFTPTAVTVEVSADGGATWSMVEAPDAATNVAVQSRQMIDITSALGTGALNNVQVRFVFNGDYYFWVIDDVSIIKKPDYNPVIVWNDEYSTNNPRSIDNAPYGYPTGNYMTPIDQVNPLTMGMGATVHNFGINDEVNAKLMMTVDFEDAQGNVTPEIYKDSIMFDLEADSIKFLSKLGGTTFTPNQVGRYDFTYEVVSSGVDEISENNTLTRTFRISPATETGEAMMTRLPQSAADGGPLMAGAAPLRTASEGAGDPFETGSGFFITNAFTPDNDTITMSQVVVRLGSDGRVPYDGTQELTVRVYEWTDLDGNGTIGTDYDATTAPGTGELQIVAGGTLRPSGAVPLLDTVQLIDFAKFENDYAVKANTAYLVTVFSNDITYGVGSFSRQYAFGAARELEEEAGLIIPVTTPIVSGGTSGSSGGNWRGFIGNIQPSMQVKFKAHTVVGTSSPIQRTELTGFNLFPNPTSNEVTVTYDGDAKEISYRVMDFSGRVIAEEVRQNVAGDSFTYNASDLPAGFYLINVNTEEGYKTMEFQVLK